MNQADLYELVADILEVDQGVVKPAADLEELGWDSLATLSFIAEVDSRTGSRIDADALSRCKTPADLHALVPAPTN